MNIYTLPLCLFLAGFLACNFESQPAKETESSKAKWKTLSVSASAYNSVSTQTEGNPVLTAWGDTLKPGMKAVAVSRDLIKKGLDYNTPVRIEGMEGLFFVKDKMHYRWKNKIDIYMGKDVKKARKWGRKKIIIKYLTKEQDSVPEK